MNLTIEEALQIYPLSRARIVAGAEGLNRVIKSVNTMDAPDVTDWIKAGEMVFTTAFAIKDTPEDFLNLLQKLNDSNAAGLGIKLGRYWNEIPEIVINEANRLHFPLLELPYEFTFADQMSALIEMEIEKNTRPLQDALTIQKNLVRFALQPGDSEHYFERIGEILSHPIAIIGTRGQILYNTCSWSEEEILKDWPWKPRYTKKRATNGWICAVPLLQEENCIGYLLIMPDNSNTIQKEEVLFHQAAEILSFHMDRFQDDYQSIDSYHWTLAIDRYLQRKISPEQFLEQTRALQAQTQEIAYICIKTVVSSHQLYSLSKDLRKLRRELIYHPYLQHKKCYHLFHNEHMISIITLPEQERKQLTIIDFSDQISSVFEELLHDNDPAELRCYISKPKYNLADILAAKDECEHAEHLSEKLNLSRKITLFSNLEFNYIFQHIPATVLSQFSTNLLRPLLDKNVEYSTEMIKTLDTFLEHEANVTETAQALYVHRNTVLYRLDKASELLEIDLKKVSHLMQLKLALLFRKLAKDSN